ncbi:hypothetical protein [Sneathiella glossodoripedis]|uniref:hypothetical protein n=1 Tax=Sneathiella glossodoripedis TaxID=418853 RepID=UPI00046ECB21|nr:hypothetical protein [Sneathiella glossodoripedis]
MRAYIPDFQNFLLWLEGQNFKYVILREPEIYSHGFPKPGSKQDVDLLVDDDAQRAIEDRYGKGLKWRGVKCDIYSLSGKGKGSYHGHPYFPVDLGKGYLTTGANLKICFLCHLLKTIMTRSFIILCIRKQRAPKSDLTMHLL